MAKKVLVEEMREKIDRISIIDPHEHIRKRTDLVREGANLFMMAKYGVFFPDLINAGMPAHLWDTAPASEDEIWERIGPYIENIQNTGIIAR